jgi:hypothetical protein
VSSTSNPQDDNHDTGHTTVNNPDKSKYEGKLKNGKANGYGFYLSHDKASYEGMWKDDMQHGFGIET